MALFQTYEDKTAIKNQKEQEKLQKTLEKYGLEELTDPKDIESVRKIMQELVGSNISETGLKIGMTDPKVMLPITYQRTIMEQNFIIIRMLNRLLNK